MTLPENFKDFDPGGAYRNYERNLPHWRQPGASYFLTFRLQDSLPQPVIEEVRLEREIWRERIARELARHEGVLPPAIEEEYEAFQIRTYRRIERMLDGGHGACVLKRPVVRQIVVDGLLHFDRQRYGMHGFVVMPNHVHLACTPWAEWQPEQLLHSWKRFTARAINQHLGREGQLWQYDTWNRIIRNAEHWHRIMRYIMGNPARARLWSGESTVWVDPRLQGDDSGVREDEWDDPW